jgi:hypothetical protein
VRLSAHHQGESTETGLLSHGRRIAPRKKWPPETKNRRLGGLMQPHFCQGLLALQIFYLGYQHVLAKLEAESRLTLIDPKVWAVKAQPQGIVVGGEVVFLLKL